MVYPDCQIGIVELIVMMPAVLNTNDAVWRLITNGLNARMLARIAASACNRDEKWCNDRTNDFQRKFTNAVKAKTRHQRLTDLHQSKDVVLPINDMSPLTWEPQNYEYKQKYGGESRSRERNDLSLFKFKTGLSMMPNRGGQDRGIFTKCVEFAISSGNGKLRLSDIPEIVREQGFSGPALPAGLNWDQATFKHYLPDDFDEKWPGL